MQISFTGHQVDITPALREFAQGKFEKLVRHFDKIGTVNIILEVDKLRHIAEATIYVAKNELHASSEAADMYSAIDGLIAKLDRQLVKHKEKLTEHRE